MADASDGLACMAPPLLIEPVEREKRLTRQQGSVRATESASVGEFDAAVSWCSRALALLEDEDSSTGDRAAAAAVQYMRRAGYALEAEQYEAAVGDAVEALRRFEGGEVKKAKRKEFGKTLRIKCRALLAMSRYEEALHDWKTEFSLQSPLLDELAFRREFGVECGGDEDDARYDVPLQYLYRRDFGNAIAVITTSIDKGKKGKGKKKTKDPVLFLLRARCRFELKEFEGAVADAERVITLLPTAVEAYRLLAQALIKTKKQAQARKVCQVGLTVLQGDEVLTSLVSQLSMRSDVHAANSSTSAPHVEESTLDTDLLTNEEPEEEENNLVFEEIRSLKKALKAAPDNSKLMCQLARLRLSLQQFKAAQEIAASAIAIDFYDCTAYELSCEALCGMHRYAKALRVCEQGLRMVADDDKAKLQIWEARIHDALVNPPPETDEIIPTPSRQRIPKAVAARKQQRAQRKSEDAQALRIKCYKKAVDMADGRDFGNAVYWLNKGESYEAAGSECYGAEIFALRARCRFELKQYEHVIDDATKAIKLKPGDLESYRRLSLALKARGHIPRARELCEQGLLIDPTHKGLLSTQRGLGKADHNSTFGGSKR